MSWNKITLYKFQQIDAVNKRTDLSELHKLLFSVCAIFNMTESELDSLPVGKASKRIKKVEKIFSKNFVPQTKSRIGKYEMNYDFFSMRFGQWVELSHYMQDNNVQAAHKILASISNIKGFENDSKTHSERATYFQSVPVVLAIGALSEVQKSFNFFVSRYTWLFGESKQPEDTQVQVSKFGKKYGWFYAAEQVAAYKRVPYDDVFNMPISEVFSSMAYLKARSIFESEQAKRR